MRITRLIVPFALLWTSGLGPRCSRARRDHAATRHAAGTRLRGDAPAADAVDRQNGHSTNRVLIYLDEGVMARKEGDQSTRVEFRAATCAGGPASGAYIAETSAITRFASRDRPERPARRPGTGVQTRSVKVDGKHYKVEFENEYVRVLRIHFGPREKGETHEHILNRVVFYVNDQTNGKADDVRMAGAATHAEENASDQPADRIAVELK